MRTFETRPGASKILLYSVYGWREYGVCLLIDAGRPSLSTQMENWASVTDATP